MITIKVKFRQSTVKNKKGTVYYQLIEKRVCKHITTPYKIYPQEWDSGKSLIAVANAEYQRRPDLLVIEKSIVRDISHLRQIVAEISDIDRVISRFRKIRKENTLSLFGERIAGQLKELGRAKTAMSYKTALRSFLKFRNGNDIVFEEITPALVKQYEQYLKTRRICNNTISFYMRNLRAIYNRAVNENYTEQRFPFKGVYVSIDKTVKRAVDETVISGLKTLDLSQTPWLAFARDLFMFSFYTRGMAFVDIAHLTKKNIAGDYIVYQRLKTGQELNIRIEPCLKKIISRYAHQVAGSHYLLPVLNDNDNYESALRLQNMRLRKISKIMGLTTHLTSYVARHSWATLAKRKGVSTQIISESMGHNNEKTTLIYLSSLDRSVIDDANARLLSGI